VYQNGALTFNGTTHQKVATCIIELCLDGLQRVFVVVQAQNTGEMTGRGYRIHANLNIA
jgi:hypothetical protein